MLRMILVGNGRVSGVPPPRDDTAPGDPVARSGMGEGATADENDR